MHRPAEPFGLGWKRDRFKSQIIGSGPCEPPPPLCRPLRWVSADTDGPH